MVPWSNSWLILQNFPQSISKIFIGDVVCFHYQPDASPFGLVFCNEKSPIFEP